MRDLEKERKDEFMQVPALAALPAEFISKIESWGFFCAPASSRFHGAYAGGLFDHSKAVMESLVELTENNGLKWEDERSPYVVGMLHDLCKVDDYVFTNTGIKRNPEAEAGHADKSLRFIKEAGLDLTDEEAECIRYHMGAFTDRSEWGKYSAATEANPNVLWTHHADMIASHVRGI